jgi:hypothetical protein
MTADEIRKVQIYGGDAGTSEIAEMLREIAAQLAELNQRLSVIRVEGYIQPHRVDLTVQGVNS